MEITPFRMGRKPDFWLGGVDETGEQQQPLRKRLERDGIDGKDVEVRTRANVLRNVHACDRGCLGGKGCYFSSVFVITCSVL